MRATFPFLLMCLGPTSTTLPVCDLAAQQPATGLDQQATARNGEIERCTEIRCKDEHSGRKGLRKEGNPDLGS